MKEIREIVESIDSLHGKMVDSLTEEQREKAVYSANEAIVALEEIEILFNGEGK